MVRLNQSIVETTQMVQPNDTNAMDVAHGGNVVKWMDETGGLSAMRFSNEICVTVRMNQVDFHHPIELGNAVILKSYVYRVGDTSIDVFVRVIAEDFIKSEQTVTTESLFTFVAIDLDREPTSVPELDVESDRERELQQRAQKHQGGQFDE